MPPSYPRILPCGDAALAVELGDRVDEAINGRVLSLDRALADAAVPGVTETVPTYRSLLVHYDPLVVSYADLGTQLLCRSAACLALREIAPLRHAGRVR